MNDLEYLLSQLNLLVGFLDVSEKQVYEQVKKHDPFNLGITIGELYGEEYKNYLNHFTNSALLLGFAHFEDFITKTIIRILILHPTLNEYKTTVRVFQEKGDSLLDYMAREQAKKNDFF